MEVIHATTNEAYRPVVDMLAEQTHQSSRVGGTKEQLMVAVQSDNPRDRVMLRPGINWAFGLQESFAYWAGQNPGHVERYNTNMKQFMTDGKLEGSAYGRYLREIPHDQISRVKQQLRDNESSRQAVINFHQSGIERYDGPDVACTIYLQFLIRDGELHCTANMRSQDMLFGYPYDVQAFQWLQEVLAGHLDVELGTYTHIMNSCHYYTEREEQILEAAEHMLGYETPEVLVNEEDHQHAMGMLNTGLSSVRDGSRASTIEDQLDEVHTYYGDWLRMMTAYEAYRFHDELDDDVEISTEWMNDWLDSL